jgi:hypothetical protein
VNDVEEMRVICGLSGRFRVFDECFLDIIDAVHIFFGAPLPKVIEGNNTGPFSLSKKISDTFCCRIYVEPLALINPKVLLNFLMGRIYLRGRKPLPQYSGEYAIILYTSAYYLYRIKASWMHYVLKGKRETVAFRYDGFERIFERYTQGGFGERFDFDRLESTRGTLIYVRLK